MKWLLSALAVVTLSVWSMVLFFYLDHQDTNYVAAANHVAFKHQDQTKYTNFVFQFSESHYSPFNKETSVTEVESNQSASDDISSSLSGLSLSLTADNKVSIDELLTALEID
ncbi:hypothetical protein MUN88_13745 [Gracilibacillus caseinilyticus]|uniref:Signal peptide containing protein n=1 Tax=Gracilibacillus caseinilyticus TaxID=2932256 RepID=A0ABY4ERT1_9BACI|nr:hypothetical protein [Gracilibacillus caseinilyticus]UOQ47137.1 hypothetical protein MUN88_13745 [Gracilibacillus caseinilyticus]